MLDAVTNEQNLPLFPRANLLVPPNTQTRAAKPHSHVMQVAGYAISFEELVQRFGARIEGGFSNPSEFAEAARAPENDYDSARDIISRRSGPNDHYDDQNYNQTYNDSRDKKFNISHQNDSNEFASAVNRDERPNQYSNDSSEQQEQYSENNTTAGLKNNSKQQNSSENGEDISNSGQSPNKLDGGEAKKINQKSNQADHNSAGVFNANAAAQELIINGSASTLTAALSGYNRAMGSQERSQSLSQTKNINEGLTSATSSSGKNSIHSSLQGSSQPGQINNTASQNQSSGGLNYQNLPTDNLQKQAMHLSQVIGADSRTKVDISVSNELANLTSRPTTTVANSSILSQETSSNGQAGQNSSGGQHQSNANLATAFHAQAQGSNSQNIMNQGSSQQQYNPIFAQNRTDGSMNSATSQTLNSNFTNQATMEAGTNSNQGLSSTSQQSQQLGGSRETVQTQASKAQQDASLSQKITEQISVKIQKALQAGNDRINIQLKPAELGKVDIKMELTHDGRIQAVVTAENKDTLDLLRRDSSELQRALQDAGLKTNSGDLSFNLRGEQENPTGDKTSNSNMVFNNDEDNENTGSSDENADDGVMPAWEAGVLGNNRLDVRV